MKDHADEEEALRMESHTTRKKMPYTSDRIASSEKLLVGRSEAAQMLSISERALDYLVANKQIAVRRIGARVLIAVSDLRQFTKGDHPARLAG